MWAQTSGAGGISPPQAPSHPVEMVSLAFLEATGDVGAKQARKQLWATPQVRKIVLPVNMTRSCKAEQRPPEGYVRPGGGQPLNLGASDPGRPVCKSAFAERAGEAGGHAE